MRIAIIEDNENYSSELKAFFDNQPKISSITTAISIENFLQDQEKHPNEMPEILLLDIGLPGIDGISGIAPIKAAYPQIDIIMLTLFTDHDSVFRSLCSGATGYVLKESSPEEIMEAILLVNNGGSYMTPSIARKVVNYFAPSNSCTEVLTAREKDVVAGIADGLSYKLIADRLSIKVATVQSYIKSIYRKLDVNSKTEVMRKLRNNYLF